MARLRGGFGGEVEQSRQIRQGSLLQFVLVEIHQEREVAAGRAGCGHLFGNDALEAKFENGLRKSAGESGSLRDGGEVAQAFCVLSLVNDSGGERLDAETADGGERTLSHWLRGEIRGQLCERERVDALAAMWKGQKSKFIGGRSGGGDDDNFRLMGMCGKERCRALEQFGIGARAEDRAGSHKQL